MSSDIQTTLELLVLNNYLSLAGVTIVVYDYILNFSREIEYVWLRPWTWVSTMFVVVRYIGLCWIIIFTLYGTTFLPGPLETCRVTDAVSGWAFIVFLSATDLILILRVYAMWNRSRTILSILLFIYVPQNIISVVLGGIYNNPNTYLSVTLVQFLDFSFCKDLFIDTPATLPVYRATPRLVLSAALVILAVFQTLKQSFEMYKATKQWQPNQYMQKLVGDGILYFIVNVSYQSYIVFILIAAQTSITTLFLTVSLFLTLYYTLIPRLVISIRELYDRDIHRRFHIDTGFGVVSGLNAGQDTTVSAIMFVGGNQGAEVEGSTDNSSDLGMDRMHGSRLHADSPSEPGSSRV